MFNLNLLQRELTVDRYRELQVAYDQLRSDALLEQLPIYTLAICPLCGKPNREKLDTYSLASWSCDRQGMAVFAEQAVVEHCDHFTLVQPFVNFGEQWPVEASGQYGPEIPHVIGHLLGSGICQAVIHALPVCAIEDESFHPKYTLLCISYFSQDPAGAYDALLDYNRYFFEIPFPEALAAPPDGCEAWWDLACWVKAGQLWWVDVSAGDLQIQTGETANFPYLKTQGRKSPYFHDFPQAFPQPATIAHVASKPKIARFSRSALQIDDTDKSVPELTIQWESDHAVGFVLPYFPVARLYRLPETSYDSSAWINLFARDMRQFALRKDSVGGLTEVVLAVQYPPFIRVLGVTDEHSAAESWVTDANSLLAQLRHDIHYQAHFNNV